MSLVCDFDDEVLVASGTASHSTRRVSFDAWSDLTEVKHLKLSFQDPQVTLATTFLWRAMKQLQHAQSFIRKEPFNGH